ncbi:MAG: hypothetical protein WC969_02890 [Elusimicrobiota bacterium]|jgi:hypothetical protein
MPSSRWERVLYRRKFIGKVTRDGVVYKKYMKVRRFHATQLRLILILLAGLIAAKFVARFLAGLDSPPATIDSLPLE